MRRLASILTCCCARWTCRINAGERISMSLLGHGDSCRPASHAYSFTGSRRRCFMTDAQFFHAHYKAVKPSITRRVVHWIRVPWRSVAGFQGVNDVRRRHHARPWRFRGLRSRARSGAGCQTSAKTTPTSMARSPPIRVSCPTARRIPVIDYESTVEMSSCGSKVLALRCVEYAQRIDTPLHVRSSYFYRRAHGYRCWKASTLCTLPKHLQRQPFSVIAGNCKQLQDNAKTKIRLYKQR